MMRVILMTFLAVLLVAAGCSTSTASRPVAQSDYLVVVDVVGAKQEFPVDSQGRLKAAVSLSAADGSIGLSVTANTAVKGTDSKPLAAIQVAVASAPPAPADSFIVGTAYSLKPEGATFTPAAILTLKYDPRGLPQGVTQDSLYVAYHDGKAWQASYFRRIDFAAATVATQVDRSAIYAIMGGKSQPPATSSRIVGTMKGNLAPDFTLPSLDGKNITLSSLRGKPVVINFWATWCPYCVVEMPLLDQVNRKWSGKGLEFLAVDVGESADQVRKALQGKNFSFTILLDTRSAVAGRYRATALPTTYFVDGEGIIRDIRIGAFPSESAIESSLRKIMP